MRLLLGPGFDIYAGDPSALHRAADTGDSAFVQFLLHHGADPRRRDSRYGRTPAGWVEYTLVDAYLPEADRQQRQELLEVLSALDLLARPTRLLTALTVSVPA